MKVAFTLLTYRPDHPSGIERSIAALAAGLRALGHDTLVLTGSGHQPDRSGPWPGSDEEIVRLESVRLPCPALNADVLAALADPAPVAAEVRAVLAAHAVDVAVWAAPVWGLGHLAAAPPGVRTALMAHNEIRPRSADTWRQAIAAADVVLPASDFVLRSARERGWDTSTWQVVPNGLLLTAAPTPAADREELRRAGPLRTVSRAVLGKGHAGMLEHLPQEWRRPVEMVLAAADFEFEPGETAAAMQACRRGQQRRPDVVHLLPALPWQEVPGFLAGACATVISSIHPETFAFTAAEALSAGTPVITFGLGYVPTLVGAAGRVVPLEAGFAGLWQALMNLLEDEGGYHEASLAAPDRVAAHDPVVVARRFLHVMDGL